MIDTPKQRHKAIWKRDSGKARPILRRAALDWKGEPRVEIFMWKERTDTYVGAWEVAVIEASLAYWKGSSSFPSTVAMHILNDPLASALEAMWRMKRKRDAEDFLRALVENIGGLFCEIDAARVRGERDRSTRSATRAYIRSMWGA